MKNQWVYSSSFLPFTGDPIEFRLEEREQPIHGMFADGVFHSRWANYDRSSVGSWRTVHDDPPALPMAAPAALSGSFARIVKRLKNTISRRRDIEVIAPPQDRARITAIPATTASVTDTSVRAIDSNQMSS